MVKVSVIVSGEDNLLNQTLEDIEIVNDFKNATGDYVYFKNNEDVLDDNLLEIAYNECSSKKLDFVVFNSNSDFKLVDSGIFEIRDVIDYIFKTDLKLSSKLINRKYLENFNVTDLFTLNWDVLINAEKFSFLNQSLYTSNIPEMNDVSQVIDYINKITQIFIDADLFDYRFKRALYNFKIESLSKIYMDSSENLKEENYEILRKDFEKIIANDKFIDLLMNSSETNFFFFSIVVYSKDFNDFENLMEEFYIKLDIDNANEDIEIIKEDNQEIKNKTKEIKKVW